MSAASAMSARASVAPRASQLRARSARVAARYESRLILFGDVRSSASLFRYAFASFASPIFGHGPHAPPPAPHDL